MTTQEAADHFLEKWGIPISSSTVRKWCELGILSCERVGGRYLIRLYDLDHGVEERIIQLAARIEKTRKESGDL